MHDHLRPSALADIQRGIGNDLAPAHPAARLPRINAERGGRLKGITTFPFRPGTTSWEQLTPLTSPSSVRCQRLSNPLRQLARELCLAVAERAKQFLLQSRDETRPLHTISTHALNEVAFGTKRARGVTGYFIVVPTAIPAVAQPSY